MKQLDNFMIKNASEARRIANQHWKMEEAKHIPLYEDILHRIQEAAAGGAYFVCINGNLPDAVAKWLRDGGFKVEIKVEQLHSGFCIYW